MSKICPIAEHGFWKPSSRAQLGLSHTHSRAQSAAGFNGTFTTGWLVGLDGVHTGEDFRLQVGEVFVGSGWDADIVLTGPGISGRHASLICSSNSCKISDVNDRSDTLVNGRSISREVLQDGDELQLAGLKLMYRSAAEQVSGYRPKFRERPQGVPSISAIKRRFLAGWLIPTNGGHRGQDFRILIGANSIGSKTGLDVTLADTSIEDEHLIIQATHDRCVISVSGASDSIRVNGKSVSGDTALLDSDKLQLGNIEFLVKWF